MIQNIETLGLRVESITPEPYMINTNVNTDVRIRFNGDLNTSSIVGNFTIVHDKEFLYKASPSLGDATLFPQVRGSVTYKDKTIIFTPEQPFEKNSRYLVHVGKGGIKDVLGHAMLSEYTSMFYTEAEATLPKCQFIEPVFGVVSDAIPQFQWVDQQARAYIFQISTEPTFETMQYEIVIRNDISTYAGTEFKPIIELTDGLYYARVKSINGLWGDSVQFFMKQSTDALVSMEDASEGILLDDDLEQDVVVLEVFPNDHATQVDLQTNIFYMKVSGKIDPLDVDFQNSFVIGELADEDDSDSIAAHGNLTGKWDVVYDELRNETYIIFTPDELGGGS